MHELVERLHAGARLDWAGLALELGYFDQSHLIRDFRRLTGYTPEKYRRTGSD
jgi:AraC-like DNA-binding protein